MNATDIDATSVIVNGRTRAAPYFYAGVIAVAAVIVFVGFAPTFYLRSYFHGPTLPTLFVIHGIAFSAWIALIMTQSLLVRSGRVQIHRRLGIVGAMLAAAMVAPNTPQLGVV